MIAEHTQRDIKKARLMRGGLIFLKSETVYNRTVSDFSKNCGELTNFHI